MKKIGIITIHNIENYGSVFQAYALQRQCELLGYKVEIINYKYPNDFQKSKPAIIEPDSLLTFRQKILKCCYAIPIILRNKRFHDFARKYQNLSFKKYCSPADLKNCPPKYDIYLTGSDQVWNARFCKGDPSFLLHFAPDNAPKISYAASFGSSIFNNEYRDLYVSLLGRYDYISVREKTGIGIVNDLIGRDAKHVLDPTLLLNIDEWNKIATPKRLVRHPYILCYYLNYAFDAYPYVDELAEHFQKLTGYRIIRVGKPPKKIYNFKTKFMVGTSPEHFLALVRDAEMVLTTSFHGTAFSVNFGKPFITVVGSKDTSDSRVVSFLKMMELESQIIVMNEQLPSLNKIKYNVNRTQEILGFLRKDSVNYLLNSFSSVL